MAKIAIMGFGTVGSGVLESAAATPHPLPAAAGEPVEASTSWMCVIFLILRTQRCL